MLFPLLFFIWTLNLQTHRSPEALSSSNLHQYVLITLGEHVLAWIYDVQCHAALRCVALPCITTSRIVLCYMVLQCCTQSCDAMQRDVTRCDAMRLKPSRVLSRRVSSCLVVSCRALQDMAWHRMVRYGEAMRARGCQPSSVLEGLALWPRSLNS